MNDFSLNDVLGIESGLVPGALFMYSAVTLTAKNEAGEHFLCQLAAKESKTRADFLHEVKWALGLYEVEDEIKTHITVEENFRLRTKKTEGTTLSFVGYPNTDLGKKFLYGVVDPETREARRFILALQSTIEYANMFLPLSPKKTSKETYVRQAEHLVSLTTGKTWYLPSILIRQLAEGQRIRQGHLIEMARHTGLVPVTPKEAREEKKFFALVMGFNK